MNLSKTAIAVDLGGESGRVIAVLYDGKSFQLNELHRFQNVPLKVNGTLHWDILRLWNEIEIGIEKGKSLNPVSIGVDTWGVDFALLDTRDNLISGPVHYRDARTDGMMKKVFSIVPEEEVFQQTGVQIMPINTLFQLMSLVDINSPALSKAKTFLTTPDLINFWLTGMKVNEFSITTTTQMYNPVLKNWAFSLLEKLKIPANIFNEITPPGTKLGSYKGIEVYTVACHDTGSAVAAIPAKNKNFAYISSGTWSLVGLELDAPIINERVHKANLTNEGGVYGTFRFLKNVMGMWIIQECRRIWKAEGKEFLYEELMNLASTAAPLRTFIIPDSSMFLHPGNYPELIKEYAKRTSQPIPEMPGEIIRCVLESLALTYKDVIRSLSSLTGQSVDTVHIIGGGSKNNLLNQFTADAAGLPVLAGPAEATVIGNAAVQFISKGDLKSISDVRQIIAAMPGIKSYEPMNITIWEDAFHKYSALKKYANLMRVK